MSETNFNPFDQSNYSESPKQEVPTEATEVQVQTEGTSNEVSEPTQTEANVETQQEISQPSETTLTEPSEEETEEDSGFVFEWPNDTSRDIYDKLVSGNISELADMIYEQKVLSSLDSMSEADIVKLKMAYDYPDLTPEEIEEEFSSRFSIDDYTDKSLMSDEEIAQHNKKIEKASKALARELKKEVSVAKDYLSEMKQEISFPDILSQIQNTQPQINPEEVLNEFLQSQEVEENKLYEQARQQYVSSLSEGLKQFDGFNVSYKDEDVQFDGKYSLTPEEKAGLTNSLQQFDLEEFYGARYYKDGRYDTKQLAEDVYFLQNRDKIVNSLITQAVSKSKSDLLKAMKNIDFNDAPRVGASASSNDDYDAMVSKLFSL
jgi:hypothetical protein